MSFLVLIALPTAFLMLATHWSQRKILLPDAMRFGMALGFLLTGVDHFISAEIRYVPMLPTILQDWGLELVYVTGAAEILGAIGLLLPLRWYRILGLPELRRASGIGLAIMLACVVVANINVALTGQSVQGMDFGAWYFWIRPAFQPVFIVWALYCSGAWSLGRSSGQVPSNS